MELIISTHARTHAQTKLATKSSKSSAGCIVIILEQYSRVASEQYLPNCQWTPQARSQNTSERPTVCLSLKTSKGRMLRLYIGGYYNKSWFILTVPIQEVTQTFIRLWLFSIHTVTKFMAISFAVSLRETLIRNAECTCLSQTTSCHFTVVIMPSGRMSTVNIWFLTSPCNCIPIQMGS